jgi:cysteine desulfurase/selenocysteine lyase
VPPVQAQCRRCLSRGRGCGASSSAGSAPYYFIGAPEHGWQRPAQDIVVPPAAGVTPQSFGLPHDDDLRSLLSNHASHRRRAASSRSHGVPYFLDGERRA